MSVSGLSETFAKLEEPGKKTNTTIIRLQKSRLNMRVERRKRIHLRESTISIRVRREIIKLHHQEPTTMKTIYHIRTIRNISIMRDHDDSIPCLSMEYIDEIHDRHSIALIEIPSRLIGEEIWDISDECSCDSDSLLFPS